MQISEAFMLLMDWSERQGAVPLNQWPGCWEGNVDEHWSISINGHREEHDDSRGGPVPPFAAAVNWNGFPAGIIHLNGGIIAAGGLANEDSFIDALKTAGAKLPDEAA